MYAVSAGLEASLLSVCVAQYTGQRPAGVWHSSTPSFAEEIYFMQNKGMVLQTTGRMSQTIFCSWENCIYSILPPNNHSLIVSKAFRLSKYISPKHISNSSLNKHKVE